MICLDSTALIEILKGGETGKQILADLGDNSLCTTELNRYEILRDARRYGKAKEKEAFVLLCDSLMILPLMKGGSECAVRLHADLVNAGERIGDVDCLIAGIMLANDVETIVTRNGKHFERVQGIKILPHR